MENSECCDAVLINGICQDCGEHASPIKYNCQFCKDTGIVTKDEWVEPNESYEVESKCVCQED